MEMCLEYSLFQQVLTDYRHRHLRRYLLHKENYQNFHLLPQKKQYLEMQKEMERSRQQ